MSRHTTENLTKANLTQGPRSKGKVQGKHEEARTTGRHTREHKNDLPKSVCEESGFIGQGFPNLFGPGTPWGVRMFPRYPLMLATPIFDTSQGPKN